jgi:S-adenosylmethionine/arginine decarboxylase-like enzyme
MHIYPDEIYELSDKEMMDEFKCMGHWGMETFINLHGCDINLLSDKEFVRQFIIDLCDSIKMKRYGEPTIERFGEEEHLFGISFTQLIYTSSIVGHCVEKTGDMYIDVFSCKEFPPKEVAEFSKKYFKAKSSDYGTTFRE